VPRFVSYNQAVIIASVGLRVLGGNLGVLSHVQRRLEQTEVGAPDTLLWGVLARQDLVPVGNLVTPLQGQDSIQQLPSCTYTQRLALQPHVKTARACDDARMLLNRRLLWKGKLRIVHNVYKVL